MKASWQMVIPAIGPPDNLAGCLVSMGTPPIPVLVVDNSPNSDARNMPMPDGVEVVYYPQNLGVAASWNLGIQRGADYTLVCSASMRFGEQGLSRIIELANPGKHGVYWYGLAWHFIAFGRALIDLVGLFDENFYPGYCEDNDYGYRVRLAGATFGSDDYPQRCIVPGDIWSKGDAIAWIAGYLADYDIRECGKYYEKKWGGLPACEKWTHPFNDATKGLDWWPEPGGG